jgi:hypothetical protein
MLRDEANGSPVLHAVLAQFDTGDETFVDVVQFQKLSANSFVWKLRFSDYMYYLYAVDFVESLEQVTDTLRIITDGTPGFLVRALNPLDFASASPVVAATVYQKPVSYDEKVAPHATESGYDFVFLYKTDDRAEEAFNVFA